MSTAISVQNVSKRYRLGEISRVQLLGDIHRWWMKRWGHKSDSRNHAAVTEPEEKGDFWALKDISFDLEQGETIAIVGANGAGKSTLLKIISRITAPTTGLVRIRGRIGTLLEVGTGFHPELTGRDNVFLNGAILGMSRGEVKRKFDDIVGFAGLEQFIDTPVKRYSSGMYVRLAFSVAAFLEPEILIVDEVLSVGDQQFQSQCTQRMEQIIKDGRTLIFVSHGAAQVQQVCRRAIFLQHGRMIFDGAVDEALAAYADSIKPPADQPQHSAAETAPPGEVPLDSGQAGTPQIASASAAPDSAEPSGNGQRDPEPAQITSSRYWPDVCSAPGDDFVRLSAIRILDSTGLPVEELRVTQTAIVEVEFVVLKGGKLLQPGLILTDGAGNALFWTVDTNPALRRRAMAIGRYRSSMVIPADFLAPGTIFISVGLGQIAGGLEAHVFEGNIASFNMIDDYSEGSVRCGYQGALPGVLRPRMKWVTAKLES